MNLDLVQVIEIANEQERLANQIIEEDLESEFDEYLRRVNGQLPITDEDYN